MMAVYPLSMLLKDIAESKTQQYMRAEGIEHLETLPTSHREKAIMRQVKNDYGIEPGYLYEPRLSRTNAMFVKPEDVESFAQSSILDPKIKEKLRSRVGPEGLVLVGKGWKKPGVLEHEFGHAIASYKGNVLEKAVHRQGVEDYAPYYRNLPSFVLGGVAGRMRGPLAGGAVGALAGLVLGSPIIYRELLADHYGKKLMREEDIAKNKTWPFIGSYVTPAVVPPAVGGAVVGGASKLLELLRRARK